MWGVLPFETDIAILANGLKIIDDGQADKVSAVVEQ